MSALPCPQMFCIFHFSTMQMRFPVQHNAELCSHAAFDMETGSHMSPYLYLEDFVFSFHPHFLLCQAGRAAQGQPWGQCPDQPQLMSGEAVAWPRPGHKVSPGSWVFPSHNNWQVPQMRNRGECWEWAGVKCLYNDNMIPRTLSIKCHNNTFIVDWYLQLLYQNNSNI